MVGDYLAVICAVAALQGDSGDDNPHGDSSLFGQ